MSHRHFRGDADAQTSSPTESLVDAFHAGIAAGTKPAEDLRVPGKPPDISGLMWMVDHGPATATTPRRTPNTDSTPEFTEKLAAAKAAAFNLELEVLRHSSEPNAKYKVQDVLERADDSLTRTKMKEQYAAANDGQTIGSMIQSSKQLDESGKHHALGLMSDGRDATTDKLAAMDPEARAKLEDEAAVWADKLLAITRPDDHDHTEHADQIASILGNRSQEELEVIRSRVRLQTSGTERTTAYEELDRTFTGRDKDIVFAGLAGDLTHLASTQLVDAAMEGDPARILTQAREHGVPVNEKITQGGRYTVLKNEVSGGEGFYDTPVGKELAALARKWNKIIYGDEDAEGFDFKMNLSNKPFGRATTIVAPRVTPE